MDEATRKKFKFKIRLQADRHEGTAEEANTFLETVNDWYQQVGKESLIAHFNEKKTVNDYSHYDNFEFGDSVDKEAYD